MHETIRLFFCGAILSFADWRCTADDIDRNGSDVAPEGTLWTDVNALGVEGRPFTDTEGPFERLPRHLLAQLRPRLRDMSKMSTGMAVRFIADGRQTFVRWQTSHIQPQHPWTTLAYRAGCDLYRRTPSGNWRYVANLSPSSAPDGEAPMRCTRAFATVPGAEYLLYLPCRSRLERCLLGGAVRQAPPRTGKPIVHYGTSIVQGGIVSRPGLACPAIVGRLLDRETVNLGFSDSGRLEIELADVLARIDAAVYIVDCGWNLDSASIAARLAPFLRRLAVLRPGVPIVLPACCSGDLEDSSCCEEWMAKTAETAVIAATAAELARDGAFPSPVFFLPPEGMLPQDGDATFDHCHPNDYGMGVFARHLAAAVKKAVGMAKADAADCRK